MFELGVITVLTALCLLVGACFMVISKDSDRTMGGLVMMFIGLALMLFGFDFMKSGFEMEKELRTIQKVEQPL